MTDEEYGREVIRRMGYKLMRSPEVPADQMAIIEGYLLVKDPQEVAIMVGQIFQGQDLDIVYPISAKDLSQALQAFTTTLERNR